MDDNGLAGIIDHTALHPSTTSKQIEKLCEDAREHRFGAVCVAPFWVPLAARCLSDAETRVASVVGFPHGNTFSDVKAHEADRAVGAGAHELDVVLNVGALLSGDLDAVRSDLVSVVQAAPESVVKVILETPLLTDDQKVLACTLVEEAGADFVKTSTGFGGRGATAHDVALLARCVGGRLGVKAAGGIRTIEDARTMIDAGATRLGCSASVAIMRELGS